MTVPGSLLAMLAGLLRDIAQLTVSPSGLTALALGGAAVLAGAVLATAVLALLTSVASLSRTTAGHPLLRRASALREKSWRAAFLRQRDPDAAGRPRPRAPSAAPAAALPWLQLPADPRTSRPPPALIPRSWKAVSSCRVSLASRWTPLITLSPV